MQSTARSRTCKKKERANIAFLAFSEWNEADFIAKYLSYDISAPTKMLRKELMHVSKEKHVYCPRFCKKSKTYLHFFIVPEENVALGNVFAFIH